MGAGSSKDFFDVRDLSTEICRGSGAFPETHWPLLVEAGNPARPAALDRVARDYWRPVYAYLRRAWRLSNEEAKDLAQDFFLAMSDRRFLGRLAADGGRFRMYVMAALDNFVRLRRRRAGALKRGGGAVRYSLDEARDSVPVGTATPEHEFRREWAATVLDRSLELMERESRERGAEGAFRLFHLHDVERPPEADLSYDALARRFGRSTTQVRNDLYLARKRFREIVLDHVRATVDREEDIEDELRDLFGGSGP